MTIDDVGPSNDRDVFELDLIAGKTIKVDAFFFHLRGDLDMTVEDESGNVIASSLSVTNNEAIEYTPISSGKAFLNVYGFSNDRNRYLLSVELSEDVQLCIPVKAPNVGVLVVCI